MPAKKGRPVMPGERKKVLGLRISDVEAQALELLAAKNRRKPSDMARVLVLDAIEPYIDEAMQMITGERDEAA